jgi:glycosyltransferase involved in cell wall biosynthesis
VGTPVIVDKSGLIGFLVQKHGIGMAVNCKDPKALREALIHLCEKDQHKKYEDALARFSERFSRQVFEIAVTAPFINERVTVISRSQGRNSQSTI